jgi:hypothetical protein
LQYLRYHCAVCASTDYYWHSEILFKEIDSFTLASETMNGSENENVSETCSYLFLVLAAISLLQAFLLLLSELVSHSLEDFANHSNDS